MARDRSFRSLDFLRKSAATSRVLNLWSIAQKEAGRGAYEAAPMFRNGRLNQSIIVKHRVRANESDLFDFPVQTGTKVLLPISGQELRYGARSFFFGQKQFEEIAQEAFGSDLAAGSHDRQVLEVLAALPSLDPFLLRESLKNQGFTPAACYFNISDGDLERMLASSRKELEPLVTVAFGAGQASGAKAGALLGKIVSDSGSAELEPLRLVMKMDPDQFREGVFCWKAFLYYKWQLQDLMPRIWQVVDEISAVRPVGQVEADDKIYLARVKRDLRAWTVTAAGAVSEALDTYDRAYAGLTENRDPSVFRDFLLKAPEMFLSLGERLSAIEHIASFWRFRFPQKQGQRIMVDELVDIFMDFESSLAPTGHSTAAWAAG